jgi:hypothetical protein
LPESTALRPRTTAAVDVARVTGGPAVVKVASLPKCVPTLFEATRRKWYVVPGWRLAIASVTFRAPLLELELRVGVCVP